MSVLLRLRHIIEYFGGCSGAAGIDVKLPKKVGVANGRLFGQERFDERCVELQVLSGHIEEVATSNSRSIAVSTAHY